MGECVARAEVLCDDAAKVSAIIGELWDYRIIRGGGGGGGGVTMCGTFLVRNFLMKWFLGLNGNILLASAIVKLFRTI